MDWTHILIEYKPVFAAILGSVATLIVSYFIKNLGKLHFSINNWNIIYYGQDELGSIIPIESYKEAIDFSFSFELILYNSSDIPKSLKDIKIRFKNQDCLMDLQLYDTSTRKYSNGVPITEEIKVINIEPKKMTYIKLQGSLTQENLVITNNITKVMLIAKDFQDKLYEKVITTIDIRDK